MADPIPCSSCQQPIPDPAEQWPNGSGGTLCQECWGSARSRAWWGAVVALDCADAIGSGGTAAWRDRP